MPLYEYVCKKCDSKFEKLVRTMSNEGTPSCPNCNSKQTTREMSVFAAVAGKESSSSKQLPVGGCGRCGGPGPCGME